MEFTRKGKTNNFFSLLLLHLPLLTLCFPFASSWWISWCIRSESVSSSCSRVTWASAAIRRFFCCSWRRCSSDNCICMFFMTSFSLASCAASLSSSLMSSRSSGFWRKSVKAFFCFAVRSSTLFVCSSARDFRREMVCSISRQRNSVLLRSRLAFSSSFLMSSLGRAEALPP